MAQPHSAPNVRKEGKESGQGFCPFLSFFFLFLISSRRKVDHRGSHLPIQAKSHLAEETLFLLKFAVLLRTMKSLRKEENMRKKSAVKKELKMGNVHVFMPMSATPGWDTHTCCHQQCHEALPQLPAYSLRHRAAHHGGARVLLRSLLVLVAGSTVPEVPLCSGVFAEISRLAEPGTLGVPGGLAGTLCPVVRDAAARGWHSPARQHRATRA